MISRRLLRVKVLQAAFAYFKSGMDSLVKSEKELLFSINKTYELYLYIFVLLTELLKYGRSRTELAKNKLSPTFEDLHPNTKFLNNSLLNHLENNAELKRLINTHKVSWVNQPELVRSIFRQLTESEQYKSYLSSKDDSWQEDKKFIIRFLIDQLPVSEFFEQSLEEMSIYWNDDYEFVLRMVEKNLKSYNGPDSSDLTFFPLYKDEEDRQFAVKLFRDLILHHQEFEELIDRHTRNWDVERIAFMDILIMKLAIIEIVENESIPTKVSFNEYIEIAKYYSTSKSSNFINGVLDKIIQELKDKKRIVKRGRGLIGES